MDDQEFEKLVAAGIDAVPKKFTKRLSNVAIVIADAPSPQQLAKSHVHPGWTLFGLYEGIPQTKRGSGYTMVLPDKITIFKLSILSTARDLDDAKQIVANTVWHEIAHHFGLNEAEVRKREATRRNKGKLDADN